MIKKEEKIEKLLEEIKRDIDLLQLCIDDVKKQIKKCNKLLDAAMLNAEKADELYLAVEELYFKSGNLNKQLKKCTYKCVKLSRKLS